MPRNDNYPDDIRCYDDDPRSPFYTDPEEGLEEAAINLADAWDAEMIETRRIKDLGLTTYAILNELGTDNEEEIQNYLFEKAKEYLRESAEQYPEE